MSYISTSSRMFQPECSESSMDSFNSSEEDNADVLDGDGIDSDIEIALYSQLHHEPNDLLSESNTTAKTEDRTRWLDFPNTSEHTNNQLSESSSVEKSSETCSEDVILLPQNAPAEDGEPPVKKCRHVDHSKPDKNPGKSPTEADEISTKSLPTTVDLQEVSSSPVDCPSDSSDSSIIILSDTELNLKFNVSGGSLPTTPKNVRQTENFGLWKVDDTDRYAKFSGRNRYYSETKKGFFCLNCKRRGHLSKECREQRKVLHCFLCGQEGHHGSRCINPVCVRCQGVGHPAEFCRLSEEIILELCPICQVPGHLREECPDLWRRYHLTTQGKKIVKAPKESVQNSRVYCYNCAEKGHYGFECQYPRMDTYLFPSYPQVISYIHPKAPFHIQYQKKQGTVRKDKDYERLLQAKCISQSMSNQDYLNSLYRSPAQNWLVRCAANAASCGDGLVPTPFLMDPLITGPQHFGKHKGRIPNRLQKLQMRQEKNRRKKLKRKLRKLNGKSASDVNEESKTHKYTKALTSTKNPTSEKEKAKECTITLNALPVKGEQNGQNYKSVDTNKASLKNKFSKQARHKQKKPKQRQQAKHRNIQ